MDEEQLLQKHGFVKEGDSYIKRDEKGRKIRYLPGCPGSWASDLTEREIALIEATITKLPGVYIMRTSTACWWNILVLAVGLLIAIIGLSYGLFADPGDSALRQTVAALWVIQGLLGLLIAAVGVFGATYFLNLPGD
jgi:hypothetical protein